MDEWGWPSDTDWFQAARGGPDELKRYHVRAMHAARQAHLALTELKGKWLWRSEKLLVLCVLVLAGAVLWELAIFLTSRVCRLS